MAFDPAKLTVKAAESVQRAQQLAEKKQHRLLRPLHLLKALIDEEQGIYGREYSVKNGGISLKLLSPSAKKASARVNFAVSAIKSGKVSTTP